MTILLKRAEALSSRPKGALTEDCFQRGPTAEADVDVDNGNSQRQKDYWWMALAMVLNVNIRDLRVFIKSKIQFKRFTVLLKRK